MTDANRSTNPVETRESTAETTCPKTPTNDPDTPSKERCHRSRIVSPLESPSSQLSLMLFISAALLVATGSILTPWASRSQPNSPHESAKQRDFTGASGTCIPMKIDLNLATEPELNLLPGIGDKTAADLIAARTRLGGFRSWVDVESIPGVGPATIAAMQPWCKCLSDAPGLELIAQDDAANRQLP